MSDEKKTKSQLLEELGRLRQRVAELEASYAVHERAEQALQESEERYRALLNLGAEVGEAVVMMQDNERGEGTQVFVSDTWPRITGYTREELLGMSLFELLHSKHRKVSLERHRSKMRGEGIPGLFEMSIIRKDGREVPIELTSAYTTYKGKRANVAYIRDITERKQAEEQIRREQEYTLSLLHGLKDGVAVINDSGKQILVNSAICRMTGYSEEELLGEIPPFKYWAEEGLEEINKAFQDTINGFESEYELLFKRKDGERFIALVRPKQITDPDGNPLFFATVTDITERRQAEKKMIEYEELNKLKSDLLSTVSHELRTPLAVIKGYSTMLLGYDRRLEQDEKEGYLESIDKATDRLTDLVDHLLDMSRLEAGLLIINKQPSNILQLMKEAVAEAKLRAPGHEIVSDLGKRLPTLNLDARRIRQVVDNILDNAIKYSKRGTRVLVQARQVGQELLISIADQGVGIPAEELTMVFDRLYRREQRLTPDIGGIGLGLAICNGLVTAHGGRIWVESEVTKGSTFHFTIPIENSPQTQGHGEKK